MPKLPNHLARVVPSHQPSAVSPQQRRWLKPIRTPYATWLFWWRLRSWWQPPLRYVLPVTVVRIVGSIAILGTQTLTSPALAQAPDTSTAPAQAPAAAPASAPAPAPVPYTSVSELNGILSQLNQTSTAMQADLAKTRIERWKTDGSTKRQTQGNADSIQRNLQAALPQIVSQVSNSPEDLAASFKLYRNLDALYDVFGSVVEAAGAFGTKDEFQSLSNDMSGLESARRAMGERMQRLASAKEDELGRLRAQVKTLTAAPPPPPKKIVVDDTEPAPKKPAPKKKPATKSSTPNSSAPAKNPSAPTKPGDSSNTPPSQ